MSVKRRLVAAGMPAAGVTLLAALALTGQPASAAPVDRPALGAVQYVAGTTPATCDPSARVKCGYVDGGPGSDVSDDNGPTGAPDDVANAGDNDSDSGNGAAVDDDRGGDGYGGVSPSTAPTTASPSPTASKPTGGKNEVPRGGEGPATVSPGSGAADDILPVTGAPVAVVTTLGALLAFAGAAIMFAMRRRRSA